MNTEIIAVGSELLTSHRQDTNSLYITDGLNNLGVEVSFKSIVGDNQRDLTSVARIALSRSDLVIFMGGLGPTTDDLTREAVAEALGLTLKRDPDIVADLYAQFARRRIKMPDNNVRQADVLPGATLLANPVGTAPGQWLDCVYEGSNKTVILLPGPPDELKPMFDESCVSRLRAKLPSSFIATKTIKVAMMSESECDKRAAPIYTKYPNVQTTILAAMGEVQFHLRSRASEMGIAKERLESLGSELEDEFDDYVFSTSGESLEQIVGYYLQLRSATLSLAESCTGGLVAKRITSVSGSSRYFVGGAVVYDNDLKTTFAAVPPLLIAQHGAVSREVCIAMAEGIRKQCHSTFGVAVTGIAGPTGGTPEKPVGLVYHAVADETKVEVLERRFSGDRERIRWWASQQSLDMLRRRLLN